MSPLSLYFLGTDEFAAMILRRLLEDPLYDVLGVVVVPDKPVGRKQITMSCPVKMLAEKFEVPVFYDAADLLGNKMDFLVVASYGVLLSKAILNLPRYAALNVHASMLPSYRGASPIQAALLHGDIVTGICVMKMVPKMDAGPIYSFTEVAIRPDHNAKTLRREMSHIGAELVAQTMPGIAEGDLESLDQREDRATYSPKIDRESGRLDWSIDTAEMIERKLRAFFPWPGVFTTWKGKRFKIHSAYAVEDSLGVESGIPGLVSALEEDVVVETASGLLALEIVQLEGKKESAVPDFVRGYPDFLGSILGAGV